MIIFYRKISYLVGDLLDFEKYVRNHEDTILISKIFQSKKQYIQARIFLTSSTRVLKVIIEI